MNDILTVDPQGIAEEKIFHSEQPPTLHQFAKHGGQADRGGEEDANDRVAREPGPLADRGNAETDKNAEPEHDRRDPVPKFFLRPRPFHEQGEQNEADGNAGESTVGQGVAEKGHPAAHDKRADRAAAQTYQEENQHGAEANKRAEKAPFWEHDGERPDELIQPVFGEREHSRSSTGREVLSCQSI